MLSNSIWLSNILENDIDLKNLSDNALFHSTNPSGEYTIGGGQTVNVVFDLPLAFKNTLVYRDLIKDDITIRIRFKSSNIVGTITTNDLTVSDLSVIVSGFEIPNHDIKNILGEINSNKILDYRCSLFDMQKYDLG